MHVPAATTLGSRFGRSEGSNEPRSVPFLHLVTDDDVVVRPDLLDVASLVIEVGGPDLAIHLRARDTSGRRLYELGTGLRRVTRAAGAWLLVNDRCDVAQAVDADGVHLPERGFAPPTARTLLGPRAVIGRSVHMTTDLSADDVGALDFVLAGSLFETRSHPGRTPAGAAVLQRFAAVGRPIIAIGGITPDRTGDVRRFGAAGVAVLSGVWSSADPGAAVAAYRSAWSRAG